jgi:hypothetical protein
VPVPHRGRDRRRVRGHQLGHRRADPGPAAGPGRPDHQRLVLARHHVRGRSRPVPARHRPVPRRPRLAAGLRARRRPRLVAGIEQEIEKETGQRLEEVTDSIKIRQRKSIGFGTIAHTAFKLYPKRTVLGLALFIGQAFLYNAVFFTQALVLSTFFGVADDVVPIYIIPFAFGNLLGPLLLGRLFDSVGRRPMITLCYVLSGVLLIGTGCCSTPRCCRPPP